MKASLLIFAIFISNFISAQNKSQYTLEKNGKQFPKIIRYVKLNSEKKIISNSNTILFNIDKQRFKHVKSKHKIDTCSNVILNKIRTVSTYQLIKDEYNEHLERTKTEGISMPPTMNHYNSRIFVIENLDNKIIIYEVDWIYSIP